MARSVIRDLGYTDPILGFTDQCAVDVFVQPQSPDIANMVAEGGAGDQGLMFGYACDQTPERMPLAIHAAHHLAKGLDDLRITRTIPELRPDGKTQVTVSYQDGLPREISKLVIAVPHDPSLRKRDLRPQLWERLVVPAATTWPAPLASDVDDESFFVVNGSGDWEIGGPASDTGVLGGRSSSIPMGGGPRTAEADSAERMRPRSIAALRIWPDTLRAVAMNLFAFGRPIAITAFRRRGVSRRPIRETASESAGKPVGKAFRPELSQETLVPAGALEVARVAGDDGIGVLSRSSEDLICPLLLCRGAFLTDVPKEGERFDSESALLSVRSDLDDLVDVL